MSFGEHEIRRISEAYHPLYEHSTLFGSAWSASFTRMLDLCWRYEGVVPCFIPVFQSFTAEDGRKIKRTVYYLVEWDFTVDELGEISKFVAPRQDKPIRQGEEDLNTVQYGVREYLIWRELPFTLIGDIRADIRARRREELEDAKIAEEA